MGWEQFTTYRKRRFDFKYEGTEIHLVISLHGYKRTRIQPYFTVVWSAQKFKSKKFKFVEYTNHTGVIPIKLIFSRIRRSLAYGLNTTSKAATDALLNIDPKKPHPIHQEVRTSKSI